MRGATPTDAAVALLADVRNPTTTDAMLRNLATLARTCAWARRYDVIVFHEGRSDALRPRLEALGNRTRLRLRARDVSDVFATHAPATTDWPRRRLRTFGIGYRRMCRFWFSGVFELADVRRLSYLMRLDTDSELRCRPGSRDPFELMARQRAVYGYVAVKTDHPMVAKNLTAFGAAYARARAANRGRLLPLPAACSYKLPGAHVLHELRNHERVLVRGAARRGVRAGRRRDGTDLREPLGRRAAPVADARALRGPAPAPLLRRRVRLPAPRAPGPLRPVLQYQVAGCQAAGGGAPVLPPPLPFVVMVVFYSMCWCIPEGRAAERKKVRLLTTSTRAWKEIESR